MITEMQHLEICDQIIEKHSSSMTPLYGEDYGTANLVRDGRAFRIFVKVLEDTKSGKAKLADIEVFVDVNDKPFARISGVTYLPNFVVDNKDVYWILEHKISGKLSDQPEYMSIDREYIPRKYTTRMYHHAYDTSKNAEQTHLAFVKSFYEDKNRSQAKINVEIALANWA